MQQAPKPSEGFAAGLKLWLLFLIGFRLLGYPDAMSIFLGAIGGLAGGWLVAWWRIDEPDKPVEHTIEASLTNRQRARSLNYKKHKQSRRLNYRLAEIGRLFGMKNTDLYSFKREIKRDKREGEVKK